MVVKENIFNSEILSASTGEVFETIAESGDVKIERIISTGQTTPEGEWYDQDRDEWVILLKGTAMLEVEGAAPVTLNPGDYLMLPAHCRHRVTQTSVDPECIWLAVHGKLR